MNPLVLSCVLTLFVTRVFCSITVWSPKLQRKIIGDSCTFRWNVTGNFTTHTIRLLPTRSSSGTTILGPSTNQTYDSSKGMITLFIWNIKTSNAGLYSLSLNTGHSSVVNSGAVLFVYATPYSSVRLAGGSNPSFEGDKIELNCSVNSASLPADYRTKTFYVWYNSYYGYFRNISSGPAVLQNGDALPGYSIKNDGKTVVIASAQPADSIGHFACLVQEEGSPYKPAINYYYPRLIIYSRPYTYRFSPPTRRVNAVLGSYVNLYFEYQANPPLTSYTNWSFVNDSGSTAEYPMRSVGSNYVSFSFSFNSVNSYGSYSINLTNSNGSRAETFQVLPPGPPDTPSNFSLQYSTHSIISLQWRCMWFNGAQQTVFVRLMDTTNDEEIETQTVSLPTNCYNLPYSTLFQSNIQPKTDYEASIWSLSTLGSSDVVKLPIRTPKRVSFDTSPANISIMGTQAVISFSIAESTVATLWLNIACCVELTAQCSNQSYIVANTDNRLTYDVLTTGTDYVFDFIVYDTDGYTYTYALAILKGIRMPTIKDPLTNSSSTSKGVKNDVAVIVLAVLLGVAVLGLVGCFIGLLVFKCRGKDSRQQPAKAPDSKPNRSLPNTSELSDYVNEEDEYETEGEVDLSKGNTYYKALGKSQGRVNLGY